MKNRLFFLRIFLALFFLMAGVAISFGFWPFDGEKKDEKKSSAVVQEKTETTININAAPLDRSAKMTTSFAPVIKLVSPSVVSVFTEKNVKGDKPFPYYNDPPFKKYFGPDYDEDQQQQSPQSHRDKEIGSGVVVSRDGYIITNQHVIEDADEITVSFANGEKEIPAKVIGVDTKTDLAVLKIDRKNLPAATFANSDEVQVGDIVLAIGNPFGLSQSVTMGIVSALGRDNIGVVQDGYEDFIQTDASINPGNSGGALVDAEGRVIGINTAIYSQSGGNQGIGFAVPINFVRTIMEQIIKNGRVIRGYLGISIQPLSRELAEAFKIGDAPTGAALIGEVTPSSPAAEVGLKEGDVITELNSMKVTNPHQLRLFIAQTLPGTAVKLKVIRDGKEKDFMVTLKELPEKEVEEEPAPSKTPSKDVLDGIEVTDLDPHTRKQLSISEKIQGALVKNVTQTSAAFDVGIRPGDVIMEIDRQAVTDANKALEISRKVEGDRVVLRIWRNNARYVVLPIRKKEIKN